MTGVQTCALPILEMINKVLTGNKFHYYVNPERDVPQDAYRIHGISSEFLQDKPLFRDIAHEFINFINNNINEILSIIEKNNDYDAIENLIKSGYYINIIDKLINIKNIIYRNKYGDEEFSALIRDLGGKRLFLHAYALKVPLPDGGELSLEAPVDDVWARTLERLGE